MARLINADGAERLDALVSVDQSCHCVLSAFGVFQVRAVACGYLRYGVVRSVSLMQKPSGGHSYADCPNGLARQAWHAA